MATVGPYYSDEWTAQYITVPSDAAVHRNKSGTKKARWFTFTQAATGTDGDVVYVRKVPGNCRILIPELFIGASDWSASTVLDVGWAAYTEIDGDAVAADPDGLVDGLDISQGGVSRYFGLTTQVTTTATYVNTPAIFSKEFNARHDVSITFTILGAAPLASATLEGYITYLI